ncbi:MAG: gluconokinase [Actinomycetota bacterium]
MLGVDIGTTNCKCVVFDEEGHALDRHSVSYELRTDETGAAEQNPNEILQAVFEAIGGAVARANLDAASVRVISFSSVMHSLMAVGDDNEPLTPLFTFADSRAAEHTERIKAARGIEVYRRTGTPLHPMAPLSKLAWLRDTAPETFDRTARFVGIKELVTHRLCGRWVVDHSVASATGLFNLEKLNWDRDALELATVDADLLSEPVSTTEVVGELHAASASELGLASGVKLVAGASDGCLANLGVGAIDPGVTAVTIGTSGAVRTVVGEPLTDPEGRTFCYVLTDNHWVAGGPISNGGVVLQWVRDLLSAGDAGSYDSLLAEAARVDVGAAGLLFLPYLVAERAPHWNPNVRGTLIGIRLDHTRAHMARAALEGVLLGMLSVARVLEQRVTLEGELRATGGFLQSELWRQMLADVFNRPVAIPGNEDGGPLGAAVLGMLGAGIIDSIDAVHDMVEIVEHQIPNPDLAPVYERLFERYRTLYETVAPAFTSTTPFASTEGRS